MVEAAKDGLETREEESSETRAVQEERRGTASTALQVAVDTVFQTEVVGFQRNQGVEGAAEEECYLEFLIVVEDSENVVY